MTSELDRVTKEGAIGEVGLTYDNVKTEMQSLARDSMPKLLVESLRLEDVTVDEDGNTWFTVSGYKDGVYHDVSE